MPLENIVRLYFDIYIEVAPPGCSCFSFPPNSQVRAIIYTCRNLNLNLMRYPGAAFTTTIRAESLYKRTLSAATRTSLRQLKKTIGNYGTARAFTLRTGGFFGTGFCSATRTGRTGIITRKINGLLYPGGRLFQNNGCSNL